MKKNSDMMYRLGIYGRGIERIKIKKAVNTIERGSQGFAKIVDIGHENIDAACEALALGTTDMVVADMMALMEMEKNDEDLPDGVSITGVLKRNDSRYVLVRKKGTKDIVENAVVATDSDNKVEQIQHLFEGVECVVKPDVQKCIETLNADECDAVFTYLDDIKAAKLYNRFQYRYTVMNYGDCVPAHGEGIYAILTNGKKEAVRTARNISHKSTAVCFEIEDDIITRVMENVYVKSCNVHARINGSRLEVYADVKGSRGSLKIQEKDQFANKNLVIRKIVDRISKSM